MFVKEGKFSSATFFSSHHVEQHLYKYSMTAKQIWSFRKPRQVVTLILSVGYRALFYIFLYSSTFILLYVSKSYASSVCYISVCLSSFMFSLFPLLVLFTLNLCSVQFSHNCTIHRFICSIVSFIVEFVEL